MEVHTAQDDAPNRPPGRPECSEVAPIETVYKGYRFRSRLEARWAVFFDALGLVYAYEPEGFDLGPDVGRFLPDFWLPQQSGFRGGFIEIKPIEATRGEKQKAEALAEGLGSTVYLFHGPIAVPGEREYAPFEHGGSLVNPCPAYAFFPEGGVDDPYHWCACHLCGAVGIEYQGRGARLSCGCSHAGHGNGDRCHLPNSRALRAAFRSARSARFEFDGERER